MVIEWAVRILLECILVTGRNEVVAKVIFLHLFVILFTGGSPVGDPPGKQTAAYGQRAAGTHPTGMHSCYAIKFLLSVYALSNSDFVLYF